MNAKNFFYTVGGIAILFFMILFITKSCSEGFKESKAKEKAENIKLTNARVNQVNKVTDSKIIQKIFGDANFNLEISDTINGELITRQINIPKSCYDTIKVGQRINYLAFSQITEPQAKKEAPKGWFWIIFKYMVIIGFLVFIINIVYRKFQLEN